MNLSLIELDSVELDLELVGLVPFRYLYKYRAIPLLSDGMYVVVAFDNPTDMLAIDALQRGLHGKIIKPIRGTSRQIDRLLLKSKMLLDTDSLVKQIRIDLNSDIGDRRVEESSAVMELIELILKNSIDARASDIHIEASIEGCIVRGRVDGMLFENFMFAKDIFYPLVSRIKLLSNMDIAQRRIPQDGRFSMNVDGRGFDFRASTLPTVLGESIAIRVLDKNRMMIALEDAGMNRENFNTFTKMIAKPHGIVLVTGPTGSGKTTTLYGAINAIDDSKDKIVTVEDPVEYQLDGIQQVQAGRSSGLEFATLLRSILRQDPDKIMIGEIRDIDTLNIAIQASLTGHLVLSTLHTNGAIETVSRMRDMGAENYLISGALVAVQAQRLVRKICTDCKTEVEISSKILKEIKEHLPSQYQFFKGDGCEKCQYSGYLGREMISEVLVVSSKIANMIAKDSSIKKIEKQALKEGFRSIFSDGISRACNGVTSVDEVFRVAKL